MEMKVAELRKMTTSDRLKAMEALWESLTRDDLDIESPDWHEDVLRERNEKIKQGKSRFFSLDEIKNNSSCR